MPRGSVVNQVYNAIEKDSERKRIEKCAKKEMARKLVQVRLDSRTIVWCPESKVEEVIVKYKNHWAVNNKRNINYGSNL